MNFPQPSTVFGLWGNSFLLVELLSTFAGDIVSIQDLIVGAAAGPAVRDGEAQAATAAIVNATGVGA